MVRTEGGGWIKDGGRTDEGIEDVEWVDSGG